MRNYWFAILALVIVLSSCQSQNLLQSSATNNEQVDSVFAYERGYSYKIRKDDKVSIPPLVGALLKNEQDVTLFEKLVFMQSRNR